MSDVVIRGMEMPQRCKACRFCGFGGRRSELNVCMFTGESQPKLSQERMSKCPLVPLPEGHGRLIDADAVVKTICNSCDGACDVVQCDCLNCKADCRCDIVKEISDAPTIIEADLEWKMKNCCCFSNTDQAEGGTDNGN